jgi:NAD(P)-dependent dehydrogenase (short-subunit alcohol dehydrogenase family)
MLQRVFITGSNRGIGLELVRQYLARGAQVFAGCRHPERALELNSLQESPSGSLTVFPLDVTNSNAITAARAMIAGFTDSLDILYNNAGVGSESPSLGSLTGEGLLSVFRINTIAPLMVTQTMLPLLQKGKHPVIANITSRMGSIDDNSSGGDYAYRASKAALNMINKSLSVDLAGTGVIPVVIHPGWVKTDMGGKSAPLSVTESVTGILKVIDGLESADSGRFLAWNGEVIPW